MYLSKELSQCYPGLYTAKRLRSNTAVMDHDYDFYLGLSYLQLAQYDSAEYYFTSCSANELKAFGENGIHYLHLFYSGIAMLEQHRLQEAIDYFDLSLAKYPQFSDVQYYKSHCLKLLGRAAAKELLKQAKKNLEQGYTINENNTVYERYPYQIKATWFPQE